jgi:hypothetical protein
MASGARVRNVQTVNDATDPITLSSYVMSDWADRIMVACVNVSHDGADRNIVSVTFNTSETLTEREIHAETNGTTRYYTEIWDLLDPTATTANVVAELDATADGASMTVLTLTGAKQQAPEATNSVEDLTHPHEGTVTTVTNNARVIYTMVAERGGSDITALTPNGGTTEIAETEIDTAYNVFSGTAHELQASSGSAAGGLDENGSGSEQAHQYAVAAYEAVDPLQVSNIVYWFRPDDTNSVTLTTGDIDNWEDIVGDLDLADGATTVNYTGETINGVQAIEFPGTSDELTSATGASLSIGTGNFYWIGVFEFDVVTSKHIFSHSNGTTTFTFELSLNASNQIQIQINDVSDTFTGITLSINTPYIIEVYRTGTGAGGLVIRVTDSSGSSTDTSTSAESWSNTAGNNLVFIGPDPLVGPNDGMNGHVGDILLYDALPTSGERDLIRDYFDTKYSIVSAGGADGTTPAAVFGI